LAKLGLSLENHLVILWPFLISPGLGVVVMVLGLILLLWTAIAQWVLGQGTPAPVAPTQRLVTGGPYRFCRNPIQLGAMIYYLGFGTYFISLTTGLLACLTAFILGSAYHLLIEEKELALRFGGEYREYKRKTPFLIPKLCLLATSKSEQKPENCGG
jgi:protein-S-isoprenylcysteine O-methyltransferase Ste14